MIARFIYVVVVISISLPVVVSAEPSTFLPVHSPVYDYLERVEQRYAQGEICLGIRPISRKSVAGFLFHALKYRNIMTTLEQDELDVLLYEFAPDHFRKMHQTWIDGGPYQRMPELVTKYIYTNERNLFSVRDSDYSLYVDPIIIRHFSYGSDPVTGDDDNVHTATNGFSLYGAIGEHVGYYIDIRDSREWGSREYRTDASATLPGIGFASFKDDHAEYDETHAHITYSTGNFDIMAGRDTNIWGRGRHSLMYSGYGAPYDMIKINTSFWKLHFSFFTAQIEQYPAIAKYSYPETQGTFTDSVEVNKYISGHRIDVQVSDRLSIGLHETVVFSGRWEASYLNPVMFLKGAEHANGDHDNALMGADFRWLPFDGYSLYGELLIDDITTSKLGTDWYGNKLGFLAGSYMVNPWGITDTDLRVEYARLTPWVYTHRYANNTFTHYGDVMGHPAGPNADELIVVLRKRFTRRLEMALRSCHSRHGENTGDENVGGDPLNGYSQGDPKSASFLAGDRVSEKWFELSATYEILWRMFIRAGYCREYYNSNSNNRYYLSFSVNP